MRERLEAEVRSTFSEQVKLKKPRRSAKDPFYLQFDNEEDYLLTHLAEMIAQKKKEAKAAQDNEVEVDQEWGVQNEEEVKPSEELSSSLVPSKKTAITETIVTTSSKDICSMDDLLEQHESDSTTFMIPLKDAAPLKYNSFQKNSEQTQTEKST